MASLQAATPPLSLTLRQNFLPPHGVIVAACVDGGGGAQFSSFMRNRHRPFPSLPRRMTSRPPSLYYVSRVSQSPLPVSAFGSRQHTTPLQTQESMWEDPDDGTGSEYDDDEDEREDDGGDTEGLGDGFGFSGDREERGDGLVVMSEEERYAGGGALEDDFIKEVEELLEPEEREILRTNALPNLQKISSVKWSPLHSLALSGKIQFLDSLLENGLDINLADKDGLTALHVAVSGKKESVISHLLRKGANPHVKDKDGASPLHYAVQVGAIQTIKLLVKYNADVNVADNEGWTPLHVAMQTRNREIAKVLLLSGADPTRRNKDGKSPLDLSLAYGKQFNSYDLVKLLKLMPASRGL